MPLRVYCPDCHAPRTAPGFGARVRCRNCDRVFRAGTRAQRRVLPREDEDDRPEKPNGAHKLILILSGVVLLLIGLGIGGGLGAWWIMNRPLAKDADDDEVVDVNEPPDGPPPAIGPMNPGPVNPGRAGEVPDGPP